MHASIRYTLARFALFFGCFAVLAVIPWMRENPIAWALAAAGLSMILSLFLLARMRDQMAVAIAEKVEERHLGREAKWADEVNEDFEDEHAEVHHHAAAADLAREDRDRA